MKAIFCLNGMYRFWHWLFTAQTGAAYKQELSFTGAAYKQEVSFTGAAYKQELSFTGATYKEVSFTGVAYKQGLSFTGGAYKQEVSFKKIFADSSRSFFRIRILYTHFLRIIKATLSSFMHFFEIIPVLPREREPVYLYLLLTPFGTVIH